MAEAPYDELARARFNSRGVTVDRRFEYNDDFEPVDVTERVKRGYEIPEDAGFMVTFRWDVEKAAEALRAEVDTDPLSFQAALLLVADEIRAGRNVPWALRDWSADVLSGSTKKPKSSGKIVGATNERDRLILQLLRGLVDCWGLKPTSGDRQNGQSACHAVAQAFSLLQIQPDSYESIRSVWQRRKHSELCAITVP